MLILALALSAAATVDPPPVTALEQFTSEAESWVLQGRSLPPDYRLRLLRMTPADRMLGIIFLRRAGLLTGGTWATQDLLRPETSDQKGGR